ncbi:MAG: response regulator, partial [Atribacterota bacterium]
MNINGKKILLIDDNTTLIKYMERYFENKGFFVSGTSDPGKGVIKIEKEKPDAVVLDIKMKGMNGFEVLEKAKKIKSDIKVIMITGYDSESNLKRAEEIGAVKCLPKPFGFKELYSIICEIFSEGKYEKGSKSPVRLTARIGFLLILFCLNALSLVHPDYSKIQVAVLDFRNSTKQQENDIMEWLIPDYLSEQISKHDRFNSIDREKINYNEKLKNVNEWTDGIKIGKEINADMVVMGNYRIENGYPVIASFVTDVKEKKQLGGIYVIKDKNETLGSASKRLGKMISHLIKNQIEQDEQQ